MTAFIYLMRLVGIHANRFLSLEYESVYVMCTPAWLQVGVHAQVAYKHTHTNTKYTQSLENIKYTATGFYWKLVHV